MDWFSFWLLLSVFLFLVISVGIIVKMFSWWRFKHDLQHIKQDQLKQVVSKHPASHEYQEDRLATILEFRQEIDDLMKHVSLDSYDGYFFSSQQGQKESSFSDFEESLEKLLDGKLLDLIKEKDLLLQQKDSMVGALEVRNKHMIKEVVHKMYFLLMEKDKLLKEKDTMIRTLRSKLYDINIALGTVSFVSESEEQKVQKKSTPSPESFIDVNSH